VEMEGALTTVTFSGGSFDNIAASANFVRDVPPPFHAVASVTAQVPEPGILGLIGLGLIGMGYARTSKRQS